MEYKIHQRTNRLAKGNAPKVLYVATAVATGKVTIERIAEEVAAETVYCRAEVLHFLEMLSLVVQQHLSKGETVELGALGRLRVTLKGKAQESAEDMEHSLSPRVVYTASEEIKSAISDAPLTCVGRSDDQY